MSSRLSKGRGRVGGLTVDTSGGVAYGTLGGTLDRRMIALPFSGLATSEQASGWDLPTYSIVHDMFVKITTASSAAGTISVGLISTTSGDADGFIASLGTSSTGIFQPIWAITAATSGDKVTTCTRGALLAFYSSGTTQDEFGNYGPRCHFSNSNLETQLSWTLNSTSGTAGYVIVDYTQL